MGFQQFPVASSSPGKLLNATPYVRGVSAVSSGIKHTGETVGHHSLRTRRTIGIGGRSRTYVRSAPLVLAAFRVRHSTLINKRVMLEKYAALALICRQGCVYLGVCTGRGLSSARGAAEAEAPEMPIDLSTR